MKTSLLSLFAGTVFLAGSAIAGAGEPTTLASAQLDAVTAGQPDYSRTATAIVAQTLTQTNAASVKVDQDASATAYGNNSRNTAAATNTSVIDISQSNTASQRNSGSATASVR